MDLNKNTYREFLEASYDHLMKMSNSDVKDRTEEKKLEVMIIEALLKVGNELELGGEKC